MRVLHTLARVAVTASEVSETLSLIAAGRSLGIEPSLVVARDDVDVMGARLSALGLADVPLAAVDFPRGVSHRSLSDAWRLHRLAAGADIVHCHLAHDHWLAALSTRKPLVRSRHTLARPAGHLANRWLFARRTAALLGVSHRSLLPYGVLGVPHERLVVIPGGVDGQRFHPNRDGRPVRNILHIPQDAYVIGMVAKLRAVKGHEDLLTALAMLEPPAPDWRLLVVGGAGGRPAGGARPLLETLKEKAAALGIAERVLWLGYREDVAELMAACDVGVIASHRSHGATRVGLEWAAAGRAIVATQVGVLDEYFSDGRDALLVPARSPAALASAITRLAREPGFRRTLGRHARAVVEANHLWPDLARRALEVYQRALA
ncbi:glycosyltransferase family 4 protein [bacterium]|nr:glycosyltransferase family 4 protein [bacterium]